LAGAGLVKLAEWVQRQTRKKAGLGAKTEAAYSRGGLATLVSQISLPLSLLLLAGLLVTVGITVYEGLVFLSQESTLTQRHTEWEDSWWETIYDDLPQARSYFGYPKREGWKAIGALRAEGKFPGDFRSVNEDFIIPIWYNYGEARSCYNTPAHFFVRTGGAEITIPTENYAEVGWVEREREERLLILAANSEPPAEPAIYALEDYEARFDRLATPARFARQFEPTRRLETEFGPAIKLVGYDLPSATVAPGETLHVNLYWQALESPAKDYRAFVHLTDGATLWGQQDDAPACRLPTSIWRPGQQSLGQFRLPVSPDTPPGRYPLIVGLYKADTLERLKVTAGAGQVGDDFLWLGDVEVKEE
jgi:hypothetical protein